jgi:hypothetical protein
MGRTGTFSLRTLFVLVTLAAVSLGAFVWDEMAGIFVYLGCLILVLMVWRHRALRALLDRPNPPAHLRLAGPDTMVLASVAIALLAAIAFCFAQAPFVYYEPAADQLAQAKSTFRIGLLGSIPLGTCAALVVYWLFWPREFESKGPTLR